MSINPALTEISPATAVLGWLPGRLWRMPGQYVYEGQMISSALCA